MSIFCGIFYLNAALTVELYLQVLSGGELVRLCMVKLLLEPVNLLILNEPTYHLDMKTKDILKQALRDYDGTLIVVSHDRDFLDGLVEKVFEFTNGRVREHLCGVYEFLEKKKMESLQELERSRGKYTFLPMLVNHGKTSTSVLILVAS